MIRTQAIDQFLFRIEAFTPIAIVSAILMKIDIAVVIDLLENVLHDVLVLGIGGTHKIVIGDM